MFASLSDDFAGADVIVQVDAEDGSRPPAFLLSSGGAFRQSFGIGTNEQGDKCLGYKRFGSGEGSAFPSTVRLTIWDWSGNSTVLEGQTLPTTPARSADAGENDNAALDQDGRNHGGGPDTMSKQAGGCSMAQGRSGWPLLTLVIASLLAANRRQRRKREVATQSPKNRER